MHSKTLRITILLFSIFAVSLACSSISDVSSQVNEVRGTAQSVVTQAQGFATQSSGIINTAQAFATQNPSLVETARAFATNQGPALIGTAQALATQNPGVIPTLQALATEGFLQGAAPADIPMLPNDQISNLYGTNDSLSYTTSTNFQTVVGFYQQEMPLQGWQEDESGRLQSENVAILRYTKDGAEATLTISVHPTNNQTNVAVLISRK